MSSETLLAAQQRVERLVRLEIDHGAD